MKWGRKRTRNEMGEEEREKGGDWWRRRSKGGEGKKK